MPTEAPVKEEQAPPSLEGSVPSLDDYFSIAEKALEKLKGLNSFSILKQRWSRTNGPQAKHEGREFPERVGTIRRLSPEQLARPGVPTDHPTIYIPLIVPGASSAEDMKRALAILQEAINVCRTSSTFVLGTRQDEAEDFLTKVKVLLDTPREPVRVESVNGSPHSEVLLEVQETAPKSFDREAASLELVQMLIDRGLLADDEQAIKEEIEECSKWNEEAFISMKKAVQRMPSEKLPSHTYLSPEEIEAKMAEVQGFQPNGDFEPHKRTYPTPTQARAEMAKAVRHPTEEEIEADNTIVKKAMALASRELKSVLKETALTSDDLVPNNYADPRATKRSPKRKSGPSKSGVKGKKTTITKKRSR
jgi:hypothetical protein